MQSQYTFLVDILMFLLQKISQVLVVLAMSWNASVVSAGFRVQPHPLTHAQFFSKARRAELKFEKGASDRNLHPETLNTSGSVFALLIGRHHVHCKRRGV